MKSKTVATLFALLLGGVGAHKFYLRRDGQGIFYMIFCWTFIPLLLSIIDCIYLLNLSQEKFDAMYNNNNETTRPIPPAHHITFPTTQKAIAKPTPPQEQPTEIAIIKTEISSLIQELRQFEKEAKAQEEIRAASKEEINNDNDDEDNAIDAAGFYGQIQFSPNKEYCVVYNQGNYPQEKGELALIKNKRRLYYIKTFPSLDCRVSNNGVVIYNKEARKHSDENGGEFTVLNISGREVFAKYIHFNFECEYLSDDGRYAMFTSFENNHYSNLVDIEKRRIYNELSIPFSYSQMHINSDEQTVVMQNSRGIQYIVDFNGNHLNQAEYKTLVFEKGNNEEKRNYYESYFTDLERFSSSQYLKILEEILEEKNKDYHAYGRDTLLRKIGEYHEYNKNYVQTIHYWERALALNPKIGIKRKLDVLKKHYHSNPFSSSLD